MLPQEITTALSDLRSRLENERRRISGEIGSYPRPIAGCDVQFNDLLEQRTRIGRALWAVDALMNTARPGAEDVRAAEVIIAMPELVDAELIGALRRAAEEGGG